jgi:alkylation response protein AidB-like acyl-CoA dehydrogenase
MDFEFHYTAEQEEFRKEVRAFIEENAYKEPLNVVDPMRIPPEMWNKGREIQRKLGAKGWYAPGYAEEYGGGGLDRERRAVLAEEFAKIRLERRWPIATAGSTEVSAIHSSGIMSYGTEDQKKRLLPPLLKGEWYGFQAFTEPDAGTDEASMKSTAVRKGDVYVINGTKVFVGHSPPPIHPDYLYWPAVTDPNAPRHENISAFFVPGDLPGITYTPLDLIAAEGSKWEVTCEDVQCPADRLVGEENKGWLVTQATLAAEHGGGGVVAPHLSSLSLRFIDYCKNTKRNGQPISRDPIVRDMLVKLYIEDQVTRLWGLRNFAMASGQISRVRYTGTQTSLHNKRHSPEMGKIFMDIIGPHCLIDDPELKILVGEVEHQVRLADVTHIGGTPETQQIMMSRGLGLGRGAAGGG